MSEPHEPVHNCSIQESVDYGGRNSRETSTDNESPGWEKIRILVFVQDTSHSVLWGNLLHGPDRYEEH